MQRQRINHKKRNHLGRVYDATEGLRSDRTKEEYQRAFTAFIRWTNSNRYTLKEEEKSSTEMSEARSGQKHAQGSSFTDHKILEQDPRDIEELIASYLTYLDKTKHLSHSSINLHKSRITLNKDWISKFIKPHESTRLERDRAYTDEEIHRLLQASDERFRVVFLLLAATGMRMGAIPDLRIGHLSKFPNTLGINSYRIRVYAESKEWRYYCFTTPELTAAIDNYLDYRRRFDEDITSREAPLIREQFDMDSSWAAKHPKAIARKTFDPMITRFMKKAGLYSSIRGQVQQCNGFRKRCMTKLIAAHVDYDTREYLIGHKHSRGLNTAYDRTSETERFLEWAKAINLLTVDPKLKMEIQLQELEVKQVSEMNKLRQDVDKMKKIISEMDLLDLQDFPAETESNLV